MNPTANRGDRHLRAAERIARRVLSQDWPDGPGTLWNIEMDLLDLLRAIQADLAAEKAKLRSQRDHDLIQRLKFARFRTRQVGDAFAWLLLGLDKKYILAMGKNSRVPVPEKNHGAAGVEKIAQGLAAKGFGFPVLHDLTHCLRIGDITFVKPDREPALVPVEIKTKHLGTAPDDNGEMRATYQVAVGSPMAFAEDGEVISTPIDRGLTLLDLPTDQSTRAKRQEARMASAVLESLAPTGQLLPDAQGGRLFLEVESKSKDRWRVLNRLIRSAHRDGFAGQSMDDGAFYYAVFYKTGGIDTELMQSERFAEGVRNSGLMLPAPANNSLIVMEVPQIDEERHQRDFMPFYLWPLTKRAIFELHRGDLVIFVLTNPAQFVKRLADAGFDVEHKPGPLTWDAISVNARTVENPDGAVYHGKYQFVGTHITAAANEFRSAEYVVDTVRSIISTFDAVAPRALTEQWARHRVGSEDEP